MPLLNFPFRRVLSYALAAFAGAFISAANAPRPLPCPVVASADLSRVTVVNRTSPSIVWKIEKARR